MRRFVLELPYAGKPAGSSDPIEQPKVTAQVIA
jgi:hypothetical protein